MENLYIGVMGATGVGKSTFIQTLCTSETVKIGHDLTSCTSTVDEYSFTYNGSTITLVDTPGFDDTNRSDTEVLRAIATSLGISYKAGRRLSGLVYLHRITDPRMGGKAKDNLTMFKKLCGKDCFKSIVLATTMWNSVPADIGEKREKDLTTTEDFWGYMFQNGSKVMRHYGDDKSSLEIVKYLVGKKLPICLDIQREMVDDGIDLLETGAGREVDSRTDQQMTKHRKEIKALQEEIKEAKEAKDPESAQQLMKMQFDFYRKMEQADKDRDALKISLANLERERNEERARESAPTANITTKSTWGELGGRAFDKFVHQWTPW